MRPISLSIKNPQEAKKVSAYLFSICLTIQNRQKLSYSFARTKKRSLLFAHYRFSLESANFYVFFLFAKKEKFSQLVTSLFRRGVALWGGQKAVSPIAYSQEGLNFFIVSSMVDILLNNSGSCFFKISILFACM